MFLRIWKNQIWRHRTLLVMPDLICTIFVVVGNFGLKQRQLLSFDHFFVAKMWFFAFCGQKSFFVVVARIPRNFPKDYWKESQKLFGQECLRVLDISKKVFRTAANFWEIWGFQKYPQAKETIRKWQFEWLLMLMKV